MPDDARYDALLARDPRFDGVFFVGVTTTGIYCRPICPARTPGRARCEFFDTPAVAERAGFRACFRCRPELAPAARAAAAVSVDAIDALVETAAHRIAEGALNDGTIDALAAELGVTARHLRRATEARLGVSPVELAQSRRLALAKQLLQDTALPLTEIAFAAGFGSVRRFNSLFVAKMGTSPSALRRGAPRPDAGAGVTLRLDYRPPYDWTRILAFLRTRAIPGVEAVGDDGAYRRVVHVDPGTRASARALHLRAATGELALRQDPGGRAALRLTLSPELLPAVMPLVARVRRMFDLDARPDVIAAALRRDPQLGRLVRARPGLRVPGAVDPFEAAVRALLGQQISVAGATTLAGRFAAAFGAPYASTTPGLTVRFPTAAAVAAVGPARIAAIGLPAARAAALHGLARALANGAVDLATPRALDTFVAQLVELPGIGPWTAHYLAMRALHLPDAFPAADLGVRNALGGIAARAAEQRAEVWRPFRAYAVLHLWTQLSEAS